MLHPRPLSQSIISVISFAVVGICIGVGLSAWDPDDGDTKDVVIKWLGLIGDLFIRSLSKLVAELLLHVKLD
jgi:Na+/H+-dicarboxylate symporter